jgi:hypothetical protein
MPPDAEYHENHDEVWSGRAGATIPAARIPPAVHRLGPWIRFQPLDGPVLGRVYAAGLALGAIGLLVTAAWLAPGGRLMGTHRQLGLPPCGFVTMTGLPCPTCGMTTAFAYTVRGRVLAAAQSQLAGLVLAIGVMAVALASLWTALTGRYPAINWYRVNPTRFVWAASFFFLAAWGLKIALGLLDGSLPVR